jgi:hypothetical protein
MKPRGRPTLKFGFELMLWAFVELMRDRKGLPRLSARAGCAKLAKLFARDLKNKGWRFLPLETIRRHHKTVEAAIRCNAEEKALALWLLDITRQNRETLGWGASPWVFLMDPTLLQSIDPALLRSKGYEFTFTDNDHFTLTRPK